MSNNFYGVVHKEDNDEFEHEESYGKDMCACSELINKVMFKIIVHKTIN